MKRQSAVRRSLLLLCIAVLGMVLAAPGCGKTRLEKAVNDLKELQPKTEQRNREIEELSRAPGTKPQP